MIEIQMDVLLAYNPGHLVQSTWIQLLLPNIDLLSQIRKMERLPFSIPLSLSFTALQYLCLWQMFRDLRAENSGTICSNKPQISLQWTRRNKYLYHAMIEDFNKQIKIGKMIFSKKIY